ncbi:MAG: hypothetical protein AAGA99_00215 [Actinomycetota bacterium]
MKQPRTARREDDAGFSLVETITALFVLGTIMVITIVVVGTAFRTLGDARETDVANNIGQARLEAIRSLEFGDVGVAGGTPDGTITETETLEVQGVDLQVLTEVEWVGRDSGLNIVPGGGDGVPGFNTASGIDYKLVTITVTPNSGDPVVFETIVSPPNITATEGVSNIVVSIDKSEPTWAASGDPSFPRVYLHEAFSAIAGPLNQSDPAFTNVTPNVTYDLRLGPDSADTVTPDGLWAMDNTTVSASVGVSSTYTQILVVYRPITLEITAEDTAGTLLPDATLVLTQVDTGVSETFDSTAAEFDAVTATWTISQLGGGPMKFGTYEYVVSAPDHITAATQSVDAPQNYPDVVEQITAALEPVPVSTSSVTFTVTDVNGLPLNEATVKVTPSVDPAYDLATDETGTVTVELVDTDTFDIGVTSVYGHEAVLISGFTTADAPTSDYQIPLPTPAGDSLFILRHDSGALFPGIYQYRAVGSGGGDDWLEAKPNADGDVSVVVGEHDDHPNNRWEARVLCDGATSGGTTLGRNFPVPDEKTRTYNDDCTT